MEARFYLRRFFFSFILNIVIQFSVAETNPHMDHTDDSHHSECDCRGVWLSCPLASATFE